MLVESIHPDGVGTRGSASAETNPPVTPAGRGAPCDAAALARAGRVGGALSLLAQLDGDRAGDAADRVLALAVAVDCRLARGDLSQALLHGAQLGEYADEPGPLGARALLAMGELAAATGDLDIALGRYADAGDRLGGAEDPEALPWRVGAALAMTRLGRGREADRVAQYHLDLARDTGASAYAVAQALRTLAATNAGERRLPLLRQARTSLDGVTAERLAAQIDTDLAGLLALHADEASRSEAVALLRGAEAYAAREDLWPLQHRIRTLLERLGETPLTIRSEALASLTATERRAAQLAAGGLTNRQVAEQLTVTVKAIEWHLSHVYRKLGIRGRGQLPDALGV